MLLFPMQSSAVQAYLPLSSMLRGRCQQARQGQDVVDRLRWQREVQERAAGGVVVVVAMLLGIAAALPRSNGRLADSIDASRTGGVVKREKGTASGGGCAGMS